MTITGREARQVEEANASGRTPVVFVHGLWLLASSWDRWAAAPSSPAATGWPRPHWCGPPRARYQRAGAAADHLEPPGRCHFTLGQDGWPEVADRVLAWAESAAG